jgi:hypothetical protein
MISFIYARGYCTRLIEYVVFFKMTVDEVLEKILLALLLRYCVFRLI